MKKCWSSVRETIVNMLAIFSALIVVFGVPIQAAAGVILPPPPLAPLPVGGGRNPFINASEQLGSAQAHAQISETPLESIIGNIIKGALSLVGVIFFAYIVWAGYLWMTAHGEEEKITQAKKMISGGVIGLAIVLAAYAITVFVVEKLTQSGALK